MSVANIYYMLTNGQIISQSTLDLYAVKQASGELSKQLPPDTFTDSYDALGLVEPLYPLELLAMLMEMNTYHFRCCKVKAQDTAGLGWKFIPKDGITNDTANDLQLSGIKNLLEHPSKEMSFLEIMERALIDTEGLGNGYIEIIRDSVDEEILGLAHIPGHTMRRSKDKTRYAQKRAARVRWFKPFGEERDIDMNTGDYYPKGNLAPEARGHEILHLLNYSPRSDYYGSSDITPALGALLGDINRQEYNLQFFENHGVPEYIFLFEGVDLDDTLQAQIQTYFQSDLKKKRHASLILTAKKDPSDPNAQDIKITAEPLAVEIKDASFRLYRTDNRDEILAAHGVPPYRVGVAAVGSLSGTTAVEMTEIYKSSIINPRQAKLEWIFNQFILPVFKVTDWQFKFLEIDTTDEDHDVSISERLEKMAALSPNEVRLRHGLKKVEDNPNMDKYYINGVPIDAANAPRTALPVPAQEQTNILRAVKDLHAKLVAIATKMVDERKEISGKSNGKDKDSSKFSWRGL